MAEILGSFFSMFRQTPTTKPVDCETLYEIITSFPNSGRDDLYAVHSEAEITNMLNRPDIFTDYIYEKINNFGGLVFNKQLKCVQKVPDLEPLRKYAAVYKEQQNEHQKAFLKRNKHRSTNNAEPTIAKQITPEQQHGKPA